MSCIAVSDHPEASSCSARDENLSRPAPEAQPTTSTAFQDDDRMKYYECKNDGHVYEAI